MYHSAKVPFAFDYADNDLDVNPGSAGDHGTHVAGIAAGNAGVVDDVVGIAPQTQILAMKVFSSSGSNGATWDDILAAADDAVTLGADVINMSLGSTYGFSTPEGDEEVAKVFENIAASGVMLSISAGNEYSTALGTQIGKGHALTANPDYGTVASPSSYSQPLSVASVEKEATIDSFYFTANGRKVAFNDTAEDSTASGVDASSKTFRSLAGQSLTYVAVPNFGEAADYEDLDVSGKIALVSRGSISYQDKKEAAKNAGAVGMVVYNNEPGMLYMQLDEYDLPSAFISQADGKYLLSAESTALTVASVSGKVDNPTSGEMSDFSSWGVTPELTMKPDIIAPGGNIKSATVNNGYTTKSGASMSAPFISGAMALTKQYVEQQGLASSETDKAALVSDLLMSTADLVMAGEAPYSPRKQGAGSVNIAAATSTKVYLTTLDGGRPKVELGDDPSKSGSYTVKFQVHNLTDEALTYAVGGYIQADGQEVTKQLGGQDVHQVTELPKLLGKIDAQTVTVAPRATEMVSVAVNLTQANKEYLNSFENGTYVEGFVTLPPASDAQPVLSIPYMGFYGDWTQAPIMDATDYSDTLSGKANWAQAYVNTAASSSLEGTVNTYLGDNPYHSGIAYSSGRNAISSNNDDYMDSLSFVYTGLLRNVKSLRYEIKDTDSGEIYYAKDMEYETKSVYDSNYYQIVPSGISDYSKFDAWYSTKKDGYSKLPNNTKAIVTITGELAYDGHAAHNQKASWSFPITINTEEPEAQDITVTSENGKYYVSLKVTDNQYVSNVTISNNAGSKELASFPADGWTLRPQAEKTWYQGTEYGSKMAMVDLSKTEQQNEWLISPAMDLSAQATKAGMVFDFYTNYYWSVETHHHMKVMASADNGANWEQIWQLWDWNQKNEFGAWEKTQAKVTIPEKFQNEKAVQFAFVYEGKDSTSLWLDNVQVYVEAPSMIHTITATAGEGGTIDPSGAVQITDGKSRTFTIPPNEGHFIQSVTVDGENKGTASGFTNNDATTAIGHLIGCSTTGAALYDCYYDKNADQFSNVDLAGDPSEGKTERRQATGWENGSDVKTDESFIEGKTASQLVSADFADELNGNQKNSVKKAADAYFTANGLLNSQVADLEDELAEGFLGWTLTDSRVLFDDEAVERVTVTAVELLEQQKVSLGTAQGALNLPETVEVTLSDHTKAQLGVTWKCSSYDGDTAGSYTFEGTLILTNGITNPKSLKAYVVVVVESGDQPAVKYKVTVNGGSGSGSYAVGETVTIKANTPASGYAFTGWTASDVTLADASASTTLTAWASTVAIAAPAASIPNPATRARSPTMFTTQATSTNSRGDLLSPSPLKMAENRL